MSLLRLPSDADIIAVARRAAEQVTAMHPDVILHHEGARLPRTANRRFYVVTERKGIERVIDVSRRGIADPRDLADNLAEAAIRYWTDFKTEETRP